MGKETKTNAMRILDRHKIPYELFQYECEDFVDGIHVKKPDRLMREGEKIVFRGKGKAVFSGVRGKSGKGRIMVSIEKYK